MSINRAEQLREAIARNVAKLADYKATGTQRMSKTGVKWCCQVTRDTLKRLRAQLRDAEREERQAKRNLKMEVLQ